MIDSFWRLILFYAAAFVVITALFGGFAYLQCHARWEYSGQAASWGPLKGCVIQQPDGTWKPEKVLRRID